MAGPAIAATCSSANERTVIFVTVGTNEAPFDRLLQAVGTLSTDEEIVVQHGSSAIVSANAARIYAQWPELAASYGRARYRGNVFLGR